MSKRSVLYLTYDGLTDPLGQSQILPYLTGLAAQGHSFTIISFEKPERFKQERKNVQTQCDRADIIWLPLRYHKKPPVLSTLYDLFRLRRLAALRSKTQHFDIVHCRSYITSMVGLYLKQKFKLTFVFDMRGFWADERVDGNIWNLKNPIFKIIYAFFKEKEKIFLREADGIVSLTEKAKPHLIGWGAVQEKIVVIPTCTDLGLFNPKLISSEQRNQLKRKFGFKQDDFIVVYLGSWGSWYMTDEILSFFKYLRTQQKNTKLLILSTDNVPLAQFDFKNDVVVASVQRSEVPLMLSISSLAVYFIKPLFSKTASSATKLGELIAMKIPLVTNSGVGDVEQILGGYNGAFIIKEFTTEWYERATIFARQSFLTDADVTPSNYFSLTRGIELYHELYLSLC